ncbi:hypothetical protein ACFOTA_07565 [Chitinophaga sp. GCM10012297]|uniref:Outer membrane protein beta-barrel domain-containing protein n=1 Tax=Chitinophaga chungangae TaxID=2821488 RepID=A0ABS3YBL5_9BACT|nr:hypothetical protein [Chitinophaga chungangae]MBO9152059.1 hypothetical protein [Chitinophaga chungangae]
MRKLLPFVVLTAVFALPATAQKPPSRIEIAPFLRFDRYPAFTYAINSINTNTVRLRGASWGISAAYKFPVAENTWLKAGAGYYKYAFNKIKRTNNFGEGYVRTINYPSMLDLIFSTDKYAYHTWLLTAGAEREFPLDRRTQLLAGISLNNYFTFSRQYHITYYNANNPIENNYKRPDNRYFGFSAALQGGIQRSFGRFSLSPQVIVPVFDSWKQDETFPGESNADGRTKWFGGIGASFVFGYAL